MRNHTYLRTTLFALTLSGVSATMLHAQALTGAAKWADSARREIDAAALTGDKTRLNDVRTLLDRALVAFPNDGLLLHYQGFATYRMLNLAMAAGPAADMPFYRKAAREYFERSIAKRPMPESYILLMAIHGSAISEDPALGQELGMEIQRVSEAAVALGPNNPRVSLVQGISALYTPAEYGGGTAAAEKLLLKSVALFALDHPAPAEPSWGRGEVYAWLGQVYARTGRKAEAMAAYKKALDVEPNYPWVSMVLIPALQ